MAMEINSKNLHKHALPIILVSLALVVVVALAVAKYPAEINRSLEALIGQPQSNSVMKDVSGVGNGASNSLKK